MQRRKLLFDFIIAFCLFIPFQSSLAYVKGIYISQHTVQDTSRLRYLIRQSKSVSINTFVIDIKYPSRQYESNVARVQRSGLRYVARLVVFPQGGTRSQVKSRAYWQKRWRLAKYAIRQGAEAIQLDYIRYNTSQPPRRSNIQDIYQVIRFFKRKLAAYDVKLQIDVFGITSFHPSYRIGQYPAAFAELVHVVCPMLYPSHYEPYPHHFNRPYKTVLNSIKALKDQLSKWSHVEIIPFIEVWNYRDPMSDPEQVKYIQAQMAAVRDAHVDGWYVWSARNHYRELFQALRR